MYHHVVILDSLYQAVKNKVRHQVTREPLAKIQWLVILGKLYKLNPDIFLQPLVSLCNPYLLHLPIFSWNLL